MRLICPNCDAEYEVDPSMIPVGGRDVQCSNCEIVWFQDNEPDKAAPFVPPPLPERKKLDPEALAVIEQEVAFETENRAAENPNVADSAKQPEPPVEVKAKANVSKRTIVEDSKMDDDKTGDDNKTGRFQDIDEINSTLTNAPTAQVDEDSIAGRQFSPEQRRARGFRSGFGLTLIASAALLMAYTNAPMIAQRSPQMTSGLAGYVRSVDTVRVWLDGAALSMTERMDALVETVGGS